MTRIVRIIPDSIETVTPDGNWYHAYKNSLRRMHDAFVAPSPNQTDLSAEAWVKSNSDHLIEEYTGKHSILVGHGIGGVAILRFLESQKLNENVGRVILVGTPIGLPPIRDLEKIEAFSGGFEFDWAAIRSNAERFSIFHALDDPDVHISNGPTLALRLGTLAFVPGGGGHFNTPEGVETIMTLLPTFERG